MWPAEPFQCGPQKLVGEAAARRQGAHAKAGSADERWAALGWAHNLQGPQLTSVYDEALSFGGIIAYYTSLASYVMEKSMIRLSAILG